MTKSLNRREALGRLAAIALATGCSQTAVRDEKSPDAAPNDGSGDAAAPADGMGPGATDATQADAAKADTTDAKGGSNDTTQSQDGAGADTGDKPCSTAPDKSGEGAPPEGCARTSSDVAGPYYEPNAPTTVTLAGTSEPGERLTLTGRVFNSSCSAALADVKIEVWHADAEGKYRTLQDKTPLRATLSSDCSGYFGIETILPGAYLDAGGYRPRHLHFRITPKSGPALVTQMYFAGDPYLHPNDSCGICKSNEPTLIVPLTTTTKSGNKHHKGHFKVVL